MVAGVGGVVGEEEGREEGGGEERVGSGGRVEINGVRTQRVEEAGHCRCLVKIVKRFGGELMESSEEFRLELR